MSSFSVIFDMDGVLIDSVGLNWKAYNQALKAYDIHVPTKDIHKYIGKSLKDQIHELSRDHSVIIDTAKFEAETREIKRDLFAHIQPLPGVVNFLKLLRANNILTAVGTSNDSKTTLDRLTVANIRDYFDQIVTQNDVAAHKPSPDVFLECATRLEVDPSECIVIEDAPVGVLAAHNAGMICIATASPYASKDHLQNAELYIESLDSLDIKDLVNLLPTK